ncbi:MAG: ectoine hydroxylase-related dioxygenase (phytanoyl-CoA dioxygenase family) [Yoonia sp.]|jgi:ectoine hydroxylase-related dioxygenase (phytanoyl-CoA dioxygenase family)
MTHIGYFDPDACDIAEFETLIDRKTDPATVPRASDIQSEVPIYDVATLDIDRALMAEWAGILMHGAGIVVLKNAYADTGVLDEATVVYQDIIAAEKGSGGADHFAASGANDRVWNSLEKLCFAAPDVFLRYFANPAIAAVSEAWLGPNYQMTAQVNLVHPGGGAQLAHRDYHLGFQSADVSCAYPAHVHDLSPALTLQGAVAHCDMPVESGPTKLLPFSQTYRAGYAAWRRDDFRALFEDRYIQLPLAKGDAVFFNPALFHGAGANSSADIHRMANLLQVSSAFGRAMETVDRRGMSKALYPHAVAAKDQLSTTEMAAAIGACAEGYSFPTNLDRDPPVGGLAPETQAALFARALSEGMDQAAFEAALDAMAGRRLS